MAIKTREREREREEKKVSRARLQTLDREGNFFFFFFLWFFFLFDETGARERIDSIERGRRKRGKRQRLRSRVGWAFWDSGPRKRRSEERLMGLLGPNEPMNRLAEV